MNTKEELEAKMNQTDVNVTKRSVFVSDVQDK
jgi:hypothetical protein